MVSDSATLHIRPLVAMPGATNAMSAKAMSGSEKYEVGNASMEYDAALDAMTIDSSHENALGMEGVDMYANQLAKLSGMGDKLSVDIDGDGVQDGIDIDGDGVVDIDASKPGAMMKYSEFKPGGLDIRTGVSMMVDPKCELTDYQGEANGIVPGYAGHIPRARDKYGGSAQTGCSPAVLPGGINQHIGPQGKHNKRDCLGNGYGSDGFQLRGAAVDPAFDNFNAKVGGIMPGYGGFRPGARDECGFATVGGIQRFGQTYNRPEPTEAQTATQHAKPNYVAVAKGVLPGYTGYVPTSKEMYGISHYGSIPKSELAQTGHKDVKGDKFIPVGKDYKAGYSGHVPAARDTFGGAHYGLESKDSPDGYKKAAPKRHGHDFRDVVGDGIDCMYGGTGIYHEGAALAKNF